MKTSDFKQHIITELQRAESYSHSELLARLDSTLSERSLRRWLAELVQQGLIQKTGQKKATRYMLAKPSSNNIFSPKSQELINQTKKPFFQRDPQAYNKQWLDDYQPNNSFYLNESERKKLFALGQRSNSKDPAGTYARKIYNRLLIDLSYNSSRLEGNTYSLLDTKKLLLEGISNDQKLDEEKVMILNHKDAIRHLVDDIHKIKISSEEVFTLHYLLSDGLVSNEYAGKIRDYGVRISASTYIPLENPNHLKRQLNAICKKAEKIRDPFEQSFFLLVHIAYLQAFADVNKRTARLSANIPLIKNNLVPLSFNGLEKEDYISAMIAIYEFNNTAPLAEIYAASYFRTCKEYDATLESIVFDEFRVRYRKLRRQLIKEIIEKKLVGKKMQTYIDKEINSQIPAEDRIKFEADLHADLKELGPERIIGLGISQQQLKAWLNLRAR